MSYNKALPYNDLTLLPPMQDIENVKILRKAITANRALAELKGLDKILPSDSSVLVNTIPLQEAKSSSEIENILTTTDELFKAFTADIKKTDRETKEVLNYRKALWDGFNQIKSTGVLNTNVFIHIVKDITSLASGIRNTTGTVIIKGNGAVIYTPPDGEDVIRNKLKNLEEYIHSDDQVDPLIKLALIHYQFEAIHPFYDGNGRAGRIINILFLVLNGLLELPVLYLSKYIIENKNEYYKLLMNVTEKQEWEPWILFILDAVEKVSVYTINLAIQIRDCLDETLVYAKEKLPSRVYSKELIELLFIQPYTKIKYLVASGIAKRQTAAEYLDALEDVGILRKEKVGKENLYLNIKLYELLMKNK